ncbi:FAD-dependent monooxygenase [Alteromonas sp. NFXS44]|uniref:FAD-dependent monooxygenase n=1 Tax=Alteromonas sp. NFXS44 TaxID=2818435 RepID=UPI0032DFA20A
MAAIKKALVVGAGIGGLSVAIGLKRNGVDVEVVELHGKRDVYHVGIVVQANFIRAMDAIGVADKAMEIGYPYETMIFTDLQGNKLHEIEVKGFAGERYPARLGMTRPALHDLLLGAADELGIPIRNHFTYRALNEVGDKVEVLFNDDTTETYDVVIGADGLYSSVRKTVFGDKYTPKYTGQGVWRYNIPRPADLSTSFNAMGPEIDKGKCGFIPLSDKTGYVWLTSTDPEGSWFPQDKLAELFRERLAGCGGHLAQMREQIVDSSMVVYRPLEAVFIDEQWNKGRIILMGDAAHGATPHMGQGAAQAVEDAAVLAELLPQDMPFESLMEQFKERRFERCKFVAESSIQIGQWEQDGASHNEDAVKLTQKVIEEVAKPI